MNNTRANGDFFINADFNNYTGDNDEDATWVRK